MEKPWATYRERIPVDNLECKKYKMTLEAILEFIQLMPEDAFQRLDKMNYTTADFNLKQFQRWVAKRLDETNPLHNSGRR